MRILKQFFQNILGTRRPAVLYACLSLLTACASAVDSGPSAPTGGTVGVGPVERPPIYVESGPVGGCPDAVWDFLFELLERSPKPAPEKLEEELNEELRAGFNETCRERYRRIYDLPQAPDRNQKVEIPQRVILTIDGKDNQPQVISNPGLYQLEGPPLPEDPELVRSNNGLNLFFNLSE